MTPISSVVITDPDAGIAGETVTATISDGAGLLSATTSTPGGGGTITGSGTTSLTIAGTTTAVDADLGTLAYQSSTPGSETVTVGASSTYGGAGTSAPFTALTAGTPVITAPAAATVVVGQTDPISGVSINESPAIPGETFTAVVADTNGVLAANTGALWGGGTITPSNGSTTLTIAGSLDEVNADLSTFTDDDPSTSVDTITISASDSLDNTAVQEQIVITVAISTPLVITAPTATTVGVSQADPISGVSIAEAPTTPGETFTVNLSDANGDLSVTGAGVSGSGTTSLTITGSLNQVNADLTTLTDTDDTTGSDTIAVKASDSNGGNASPASIEIAVNEAPVTAAPTLVAVVTGQATAISGIILSEAGNTSGETFTVTLADANGDLSATGSGISGSGTTNLTITGSLSQVNDALATLTDTDASTASDTITVNAIDSLGGEAPGAISVIPQPTASTTDPVLSTSSGTLDQFGNTYVLNLGSVTQGDTPELIALSLLNDDMADPTDLLSVGFSTSNTAGFFSSFNDISDLGAGDGSVAGYVAVDTSNLG